MDARFVRQTRFAPFGAEGQANLGRARVLVVGCGALGGALAQSLHRAGVGELVLVDRDVVEESNLPRQVLFDAEHAARRTPKVEAAKESLLRVGGPTRVEAVVAHLDAALLHRLGRRADLVLDGTDNLATRYLVNDFAVRRGVPWVYGGVVGSGGIAMAIVPGGPCLRCLFPEPAPAGTLPTCDSAGVLQPAVAAIASVQAGLALRILARRDADLAGAVGGRLVEIDVWHGDARTLVLDRDPSCPCCAKGEFPFLADSSAQGAEILCGRNAVQVPPSAGAPDLDALAARLAGAAVRDVARADGLLRFATDGLAVTVFSDGRALVEGTEDVHLALAVRDRLLS
ncbi:MAG: ThiF family adenylyltransferase [Planctomycetota bacterium]